MKVVILSDIHFGSTSKFDNSFLKTLSFTSKKIKEINPDIIFFAGDTFDRAITLADRSFTQFSEFFVSLPDDCLKVFIEGTNSHDRKQGKKFPEIFDNTQYYDEVSLLNVKGKKILLLPEQYLPKSEYHEMYKDLFNKKYDLVVGHGNIESMIYTGSEPHDDTRESSSSPPHDVSFLKSLTDNYTIFGHNHIRTYDSNINPKVIYNSSLFRTSYEGEGIPPGFHVVEFHKNKKAGLEFIENKNIPYFRTFKISDFLTKDDLMDEAMDTTDFIDKINIVINDIKKKNLDRMVILRMDFQKLPISSENNKKLSILLHIHYHMKTKNVNIQSSYNDSYKETNKSQSEYTDIDKLTERIMNDQKIDDVKVKETSNIINTLIKQKIADDQLTDNT